MDIAAYLSYEWLKSFHIIAMVSWFAGLFYLPRFFVYHASIPSGPVHEQFCIMEYKLYYYIMRPAMIVTIVLGVLLSVLLWDSLQNQAWFWGKVTIVVLLLAYHFHCGHLLKVFAHGENQRDHKFYRMYNELPTLALMLTVIAIVVRPFAS